MVKLYILFGLYLCGLFLYANTTDSYILNLNADPGVRPTGPGAHYHK